MMNLYAIPIYAKSPITKVKPVGVMATAVNTDVAVSWEPVAGATGYQVYEAVLEVPGKKAKNRQAKYGRFKPIKKTKQTKCVLKGRKKGKTYCYFVRAYKIKGKNRKFYSKASKKVSTTVAKRGSSTIKNFLKTAIAPVGSTMYVWGGGWNEEDTGAGKDARRIGLSAVWRAFAKDKDAGYNYRDYRYQIHNGLDCSGYVGWCVYNVLNTKNNQPGYVCDASEQAIRFSWLGFGNYYYPGQVQNYCAGDVMSSACTDCGHVWIVIGQCSDGSVVLVHSSPSGVQLCGTATPSGEIYSMAYGLAEQYMKKYYPSWYTRYPNVGRGTSYLSHYGQMRWKTSGKGVVLSDPDGYQKMSAQEVLEDLFAQ
ncbi:MAG: hypothetical protein NC300_08390 [Bacteroidales bacterium]|nr:hypothetical protein [Clostridium sp.]MCM1204150.1 hypothetical protein [Bacteroidales bacterium]